MLAGGWAGVVLRTRVVFFFRGSYGLFVWLFARLFVCLFICFLSFFPFLGGGGVNSWAARNPSV